MTIQEMHYDIKLRVNRLDSNLRRDLHPAEIDWTLNNWAIPTYIKNVFEGFELTSKLTEKLKELVVKSPTSLQPAVPATQIDATTYEVKISDFAFDMYYLIRLEALIRKGNCPDRKVNVKMVQHDDLTSALGSALYKPSFEWKCVLGVEGESTSTDKGSLYIYTDGTFSVVEVYPEYIRKPAYVWEGSYNTLNTDPAKGPVYVAGTNTPVDCDLNPNVHDELCALAAVKIALSNADPLYQSLAKAG